MYLDNGASGAQAIGIMPAEPGRAGKRRRDGRREVLASSMGLEI